jgi:alkylhydroperoxidase family enzyme
VRIEIPDTHGENPMVDLATVYAPDIVQSGMRFSSVVYEKTKLSLRELEATRYRTAQINGCTYCQSWRSGSDVPKYLAKMGRSGELGVAANGTEPDEQFYSDISEGALSSLTIREQLAVQFADAMGNDPKALAADEQFWSQMKAHFSDYEIVDLTFSVAAFLGLGRAMHVLGLDTVCVPPNRIAASR